ncbi:MAG: protein kinase [Anaerolineae bacterium]|nr:protein kinase [Anaerolineae bacterium]
MSEWIGQIIGGYQLAEEVGRGSVAVVYRAYQSQLERWVALKLLDVQMSGGSDFLHRFRQEARSVAALRHPNIVNIYDYGEEKGMAYIVMELIPTSLAQRLESTPMLPRQALELVLPMARALAYAHSQQIVHRDVKPANILLARSDWPLLGDFGLAKVVGARQKLTEPGAIVRSTAVYLSPEQVAGQEVDQRTDIYSLGVVLFQLLSGQLPFPAETPAESMIMRMYQPAMSLKQIIPQTPGNLDAVLQRALARELNERYAKMDDFARDLQNVLDSMTAMRHVQVSSQTTKMIPTLISSETVPGGPQLFIATTGSVVQIPIAEEVLIGRRDPLSPRLPDVDLDPYGGELAGVSRQHARLLHKQDGWWLEDLQSTNGTFVNEVRLLPHRPVRLRSADIVRFGQLAMIFNE